MATSRINDIMIFLSVVDTGSFVAAGKAHGLTRSTAGKAIARLEKRYGLRLLNRTTRAISLTEDGQKLYKQGLNIRTAIDATDASMIGLNGEPVGLLRIAAPDALGRKLLLPIAQEFLEKWPDVRLEISFTDSVKNLVYDGFDLAFRIGVTAPDSSLITRTLRTEQTVLCASPSYLAERSPPKTIEHLSTHDLIQFTSSGERQGWELRDGPEFWQNAPGKIRLRFDSAAAIRDAASQGMGIALLPFSLVQRDIERGDLIHILPTINCGDVPIIALYPHKQFLDPKVRHFLDMVVKEHSKPTIVKNK